MGLFKKKKLYKITYTEKYFSSSESNCRYKTTIIAAKNEVKAVNKFCRGWKYSYTIVSIAPYRVSKYSEVVENFVNSRGLR